MQHENALLKNGSPFAHTDRPTDNLYPFFQYCICRPRPTPV